MSLSDFISSSGGAGAFGAAGSLASGILGNIAQSNANKTNLQIARETNQANLDIANANNQLQRDLWHEQRDWNSYSNQRALLEAAGYNPNSLFDTNGVVGASSAPPQMTSAEMQSAQVNPVDSFARSVGSSVPQLAQTVATLASAKKSLTEAEGQEIDNRTRASENWSRIRKYNSDANVADSTNELMQKTMDDTVNRIHEEQLQAQTKTFMDNLRYEIDFKYMDKERQANLDNVLRDIELKVSQGKYYGAQIDMLKFQQDLGLKQYQLDQRRVELQAAQTSAICNLYDTVAKMNTESLELIRQQIQEKKTANGIAKMTYDSLRANDYINVTQKLEIRKAVQALQQGKLDMQQTKVLIEYYTKYGELLDAEKYGKYLDLVVGILKSPATIIGAYGDAANTVISAGAKAAVLGVTK